MESIAQTRLHFRMLCLLLTSVCGLASDSNTGDFAGSISIALPAGSTDSPYYRIISPSLKGQAVFRGLVDSVSDNNISFSRVPDLLDPTTLSNPFKPGMLACRKARATANLDADGNQTVSSLTIYYAGLLTKWLPRSP